MTQSYNQQTRGIVASPGVDSDPDLFTSIFQYFYFYRQLVFPLFISAVESNVFEVRVLFEQLREEYDSPEMQVDARAAPIYIPTVVEQLGPKRSTRIANRQISQEKPVKTHLQVLKLQKPHPLVPNRPFQRCRHLPATTTGRHRSHRQTSHLQRDLPTGVRYPKNNLYFFSSRAPGDPCTSSAWGDCCFGCDAFAQSCRTHQSACSRKPCHNRPNNGLTTSLRAGPHATSLFEISANTTLISYLSTCTHAPRCISQRPHAVEGSP